MTFNLNNRCRVKLLDSGRALLEAHRVKMRKIAPEQNWTLWKAEDADGTVTLMAWELFQLFGPVIRMGTDSPIDHEIEILPSSDAPPAQQETTGNDQPTGPVSEASESPNKEEK